MNSAEDRIKKLIYEFFVENENRIIDFQEIKKIIGNYTSTQVLDILEKIEDEFKIDIYYDKRKKRFSLKELSGFKKVSDLTRNILIGFISNPRLLSRYSSISALYAAYKVFELEDVIWVDSIGLFQDTLAYKRAPSKKAEYLPEMEDLTRRIRYVARIYPKIEGVKTHVLPTKRDIALFRVEGRLVEVNQIKELCELRSDIRVEERPFQDVYRTNVRIYLVSAHNDDGVTSSYTRDAQERVEKLDFDKNYYNIVVLGGYHVPFEIPNYGGADYVISLPSLIFQTRYMKEMRRVAPFIGCYVLELNLEPKINGIRRLRGIRTRLYNLARYAKQNDFYEYPKMQDAKEKALVEYIVEKYSASMGEICRNLRMREDEVRDLVYRINERENNIIIERGHKFYIELPLRERFDYPNIERGEKHKYLYLSDTHINSNYTNIEDISFVVSTAKNEKVEAAFHTGDITESVPGFEVYSGQRFRVRTQSARDLINYVRNFFNIFTSQGIPLYFITGNHDTKIAKTIGLDLLELVSELYSIGESKDKIIFVGEERGTVEFTYNDKKLKINMVHPQGGSADTLGYNARKFYRYLKLIGNEKNRILLIGNYHRAIFIYDPLHFPTYLVPCMKYPDEYVETKGLLVHKGAWITTLELDQKGFVMIENKYISLPVREEEKTVKSFNGVKISNEIV